MHRKFTQNLILNSKKIPDFVFFKIIKLLYPLHITFHLKFHTVNIYWDKKNKTVRNYSCKNYTQKIIFSPKCYYCLILFKPELEKKPFKILFSKTLKFVKFHGIFELWKIFENAKMLKKYRLFGPLLFQATLSTSLIIASIAVVLGIIFHFGKFCLPSWQ